MLLGWLRGRQWTSSCGAFITVAALIVDPFAQQVLSTYNCRLPAEDVVATIPRTNVYNENVLNSQVDGAFITLELQNSINGGIFNPGENVAIDCPTGNCIFPNNYHTVGFCSSCIDTTNKLYIQQGLDAHNHTVWSFSLPANGASTASNLFGVSNEASFTGERSDHLFMKSEGGKTDIIVGYLPTNRSAPCTASCPSMANRNFKNCNASWNQLQWGCKTPEMFGTGIGAAQCSLFPCVKTYTAVVNGGRWTESLVSVSNQWGRRHDIGDNMVNVECLDARDRQAFLDAGLDVVGKSWVPYNTSIFNTLAGVRKVHLVGQSRRIVIPGKCIYQYGTTAGTAGGSIVSSLDTYFNGTVRSEGYPGLNAFHGPTQLRAIYNEGRITFDRLNRTWRNLSDSITTHIRQHGALDLSAPATGQAFRDQTCVHIRWLFLAYPAFLVLSAIVFFICMISETRRVDTSRHDWKSSPLPLLFHGLDREALQTVQTAELVRTKQMEEVAERMSVRLSQTRDGWQFVGRQDVSPGDDGMNNNV